MSDKVKAWLYAFRLRTLPLAFSSIITGSAVAYVDNKEHFKWLVFGLGVLTTLFLQILSNLANDYGDSEKGTDNADRIGPVRAVQAGLLSFSEIRKGILVFVVLSLFSGIALIVSSNDEFNIGYSLFFFLLGIGAIVAAIKYTIGNNAYGYRGLGDVFVMMFFGLVGVCGSHYLLSHKLHPSVLLPAFTIGAFASGVLNLNNMRDHISDEKAGKITLVVKIGLQRAKMYHRILIFSGFFAAITYGIVNYTSFVSNLQFLFIITIPLFRRHLASVKRIENLVEFDPLLKELAIGTFIFSIVFAIGVIVATVA